FNPADKVFRNLPELDDPAIIADLKRPDTVLIDRQCHPDFGLTEGAMPAAVQYSEIGGRRVHVVGYFTMGTGFASDGSTITSDETFSRLVGGWPLDRVSLGLVRLNPGANRQQVVQALREILPPDVAVLTRTELEQRERDYWLNGKSIGILFTCGVL